jgi:hypothetical protein
VQELQLVSAACPHCAQSLAVPGQNLRTCVRCPRCREVLSLEAIVSRKTPIVPAFTWSSIGLARGADGARPRERAPRKDAAEAPPVDAEAAPAGSVPAGTDDAATLKDLPPLFPEGTVAPIGGAPAVSDDAAKQPPKPARKDVAQVFPRRWRDAAARAPAAPPEPDPREPARPQPTQNDPPKQEHVVRARPQPARPAPLPRSIRTALDRLARADFVTAPYQWRVIAGLTALVCGAEWADDAWNTAPTLRSVSALLLLTTWFAIVLGHVASIRSDDGSWSIGEVFSRMREARHAFEEHARHIGSSTPAHRKRLIGKFIVSWSSLLLAAEEGGALLRLFGEWFFGSRGPKPSEIETYVATGAAAAFTIGWFVILLGRRSHSVDADEDDSLEAIYRARASVLPKAELTSAAARFQGRAKEVVLSVVAWKARRRARNEHAHVAHLARHLDRTLTGPGVTREPLLDRASGVVARAGLVLDGQILVLVRRAATLANDDRTKRSIQRYRDAWKGRPILLVVVETTDDDERKALAKNVSAVQGEPRVLGVWA